MMLALMDKGWASLVLIGTVWKRQELEYQKRDDTPGVDLAYHIGGALLAVGLLAWLKWFTRGK